MKNIKIRYADKNDRLYLNENDKHISETILKNKIGNNEIYLVEKNGTIIGYLRYNLFWDSVPFMNMIYISGEYRNVGIGRELVKYWEDDMRRKGYKSAMTSTQSDEDAQHFYRKLGYKEIGGFKYFDDPYEIMFHKIF